MYCTIADLLLDIPKGRLVSFVNDEDRPEKDADNPDGWDLSNPADLIVTRLAEYISKACNEIDGYLGGRYTLPLTSTPERITEIACVIVRYKLHMRREIPVEESPAYSEYKNVRRELEDIRDGDIVLSGLSLISRGGIYRCNKTAEDRVFSREFLNNW
jgi:phage gp36-like protein